MRGVAEMQWIANTVDDTVCPLAGPMALAS